MQAFERILCPVDFSDNSVKALQWTDYLAGKFGSTVFVLHVTAPYYPLSMEYGFDYEKHQNTVAEELAEFVAPLKAKHEVLHSTGDAAYKIADLALGLNISLVIMGTGGLNGPIHRLLGSTTEKVVRRCDVPVMTVAPSCHPIGQRETHRILMPLTSVTKTPKGYRELRNIVRVLDADVTLMHVVEFKDPMFDSNFDANPFLVTAVESATIEEQLKRIGQKLLDARSLQTVVGFGRPAQEVIKEADENKYDFIMMGARRRTFLTPFVESTAHSILSHSRVPVITVKVD